MIHGPWISLLGKGNDFQRRMKKKNTVWHSVKTHIQRVHFSGTSVTYVEILQWKWTNTRNSRQFSLLLCSYVPPDYRTSWYVWSFSSASTLSRLSHKSRWGTLKRGVRSPSILEHPLLHTWNPFQWHSHSRACSPPYPLHGMSHPTGMS